MAYGSSEASGSRAGDGSTGSGSGAAAAGGRRPGPKEAKTVRPSGHPARHISFDEAERPEATEASPLLSRDGVNEHSSSSSSSSADSECEVEVVQREEAFHETKSLWYLILLTIGMFGVQISWSVELSYGTPYLVSLGLSKSVMALVWIAGPLSGTLVQPYVGMLSDRCRLRWGKRKPFMIGGTIATVLSLLNLGWTKEIVGGFLGLFGFDPASNVVHVSICAVAVLWIYVLDFAINTGPSSPSPVPLDTGSDVYEQCKLPSAHSSWIVLRRTNKVRI